MPAVSGSASGTINYYQIRKLIQVLVNKANVFGTDIIKITPSNDINGIEAISARRFICNLIGSAVRARYFNKGQYIKSINTDTVQKLSQSKL